MIDGKVCNSVTDPKSIMRCYIWDKIRQMYQPKNFLSPVSLKVREIIVLLNLF